MLAPIRSPVKEPGPDIKVILVISCQSLWCFKSLSWMYARSFSARSWLKLWRYVLSSNFRIVSGEDVSKYNSMV